MNVTATYWKYRIWSWWHRNDLPLDIPAGEKKCFVFLSADYPNLGDVAIGYAQHRFLKERLSEYTIVDVPASKTLSALQQVKRIIGPDDIVTIAGGGNMSDLYPDLELLRLMIVRTFPRNKVIAFPLTAIYGNTKRARELQLLGKRIYRRHKNFTMAVRDETTLSLVQDLFPDVKTVHTPDIVVSLDYRKDYTRDNTVMFCMRNDFERATDDDTAEKLKDACRSQGLKIECFDTLLPREDRLSAGEAEKLLTDLWERLGRCALVVTDRLHAMLFAYITGTPAIVMPNNNHKVTEIYQWIKDCGNITMIKSADYLPELIGNALNGRSTSKHSGLLKHFDNLL